MADKAKIKMIYDEIMTRIRNVHISCFKGMTEPLFLISDQYPGLWMEHTYDSVIFAQLEPEYINLAENAINLFIDRQTDEGQLPFTVMDGNKLPNDTPESLVRYSHIQECVSFLTLALEVYEMRKNKAFLEKVYNAGCRWNAWFKKYRMTTGRGLIEMFCGFDTGHDNSGRLDGIAWPGGSSLNGVRQNASVPPPDDGVTPILAVDMNCNFYADAVALSKMAAMLGKDDESRAWSLSAEEIKKNLFKYCYDEEDNFFYDVDRNSEKRKYKSSTIFHLFLEKVLDKENDAELIRRIYKEHIKNPDEFWTSYPFPSMAVNDPSVENHPDFNCWGYYTQGLIVLRCIRWMDYYGWSDDLDYILTKWVETWTEHFDTIKLAQEIDPITGVPTESSEWYSSCMLAYVYAVRRLKLI